MFRTSINLIVASTPDMGIGCQGTLPWRLKKEMLYFSKMTKTTQDPSKKNAVIMGRKTWESIPEKNRPLKGRVNFVLSSKNPDLGPKSEDLIHCYSLKEAIDAINSSPLQSTIESIWIVGGAVLYKAAFEEGYCDTIYWTEILKDFECDTFLPKWDTNFTECGDADVPKEIQEENGIRWKYHVLRRFNE